MQPTIEGAELVGVGVEVAPTGGVEVGVPGPTVAVGVAVGAGLETVIVLGLSQP